MPLSVLRGPFALTSDGPVLRKNWTKASIVRFTVGDMETLRKLETLTGLERLQIIRFALKLMLRSLQGESGTRLGKQ